MLTLRLACATTLCLSAVACTSHPSDEILTNGIYADISAEAHGDGTTTVITTLYLDNPLSLDFVELVGDDNLVAWSGDDSKDMSESMLFGATSYLASFDYDDPDTDFHVGLNRSVDGGAPDSSCTLPDPFDITTELPGELPRSDDLTIEWAPAASGDQMSWTVDGDCLQLTGGTVDSDTGSVTIAADSIQKGTADSTPDSCMATLELRRSRPGDLDPGYGKGGTITASQVRRVMFTSVP